MSPNTQTIPRDPLWLAHRYIENKDAVQFRHVTREEHRAATFVTDEYLPRDAQRLEIDRRQALAAAAPAAPVHFIFHSAFCCSTLLARAFDRDGVAMALKEPAILNDITGWRRRGASGRDVAEAMDGALALLARPFAAGEAVVIKPSNIVSGLIPMMMALRPDAKALLLHAPLPLFLTSVAKKGLDGRLWVRELFMGLRTDGLVQRLGFDDAQFFGQTDLQIAAAGWLAQQALFAELARALAPRVRTLDSESLLDAPEASVAALARLYGLGVNEAQVAEIVAAAFGRNSKSGEAFGRAEREAEYAGAAAAHRDELEKVGRWAEVTAERAGIPMTLPGALLG
ncbi:hypothetical protein GON01_14945 [Sphingomonas sp. MAH-20]|uniref:Sulfotransferase family protein n=1 Tax=Sphingomonas horti TaxID=2682842 RepID=A0A6I4J548_9SPHN|nr:MULTISPECIES: hypothetical protein [Sphingomonas]MBA2919195.1 hypothetical protein [Sphingomonas sp. CGMCC 1.13658]MVO79228.1 hypothetical protein [Sphingomonas horti]